MLFEIVMLATALAGVGMGSKAKKKKDIALTQFSLGWSYVVMIAVIADLIEYLL